MPSNSTSSTASRAPILRAKAAIARDAFLIGGIFRIEAVKRPMLWIETASLVAAACERAHFVVLGDGAMAQQMRDFAQKRGLASRLHMPGFVSNVGEWLRVIDLNLLTSEREGLPNVLIEGQHFGVPAVSSDVGGAFETMEPGVTGHLVPAESDAGAFAGAILKVIADPLGARRHVLAHPPMSTRNSAWSARSTSFSCVWV